MKRSVLTLVAVAASATALSASIKFTSVWKSMDAGAVSFAGKKVAALVISQDDSLRVSGEESLAGELSSRGMQGVATYRTSRYEPGDELCCPARITQSTLAWNADERRMRVKERVTFAPAPAAQAPAAP